MTNEEFDKRDRRLNLKNLADSILELLEEVARLEEINEEHQKLNGELREENKKLREILEGKSIQEMGVSKLYEEGTNEDI